MSSQRERDRHRSTGDRGDPDTARAEGNTQRAIKPAIIVERLTKQFGEGADAVTAVNDISFTVEPGSIVGLLSPNDAGENDDRAYHETGYLDHDAVPSASDTATREATAVAARLRRLLADPPTVYGDDTDTESPARPEDVTVLL